MPARRRTNFPRDVRAQALDRADSRCEAELSNGERCPCPIPPGGRIFAHVHPDRAGRRASLDNCKVVCLPCDKATFPADMRLIAKVRRQEVVYVGLRCSSRPMRGSVFSRESRGLDGLTRPWIVDVRSL